MIGNPKEADKKLFKIFRVFSVSKKKVFITKSTAAKPFAFTHFARYMKYEIGEDASFVLVAFLFNSDKLRIVFAKLKKKRVMDGQTDGWMDRWTDRGMERRTYRLIEMSRRI